MCGIAGLAGSRFSKHYLHQSISLACEKLQHRGPDQQGVYMDEGAVLGIQRLAIRDSIHGSQPMTYRGYTIVYNGELYNCNEIKQELEKRNHLFETACDTEVFLKAFVEFGPSVLQKLDGMFAAAIWNSKSKTLYLCRDRWGEKPLYFTKGDEYLAFASEIKALKVWPHISWTTQLEDIWLFLKNSYLPSPRTGWKNIYKLEPGSLLTWHQGSLSQERYYTPKIIEDDTCNEKILFDLLNDSVKRCAQADRPVGVFLSGGLDSSSIAYFLSQHQNETTAFSLLWNEKDYTESQYASAAADKLGLNHWQVTCDSKFMVENFDFITNLYDEPFGDESMIPTYCLAKFAKQQVDVVLTGDGADELFHGYERYFFSGSFKEYIDVFSATPQQVMESIFIPKINSTIDPFVENSNYSERYRSWIDMKTYLSNNILMKIDRACMGVSLESRAPFLTQKVSDFALRCPFYKLVRKDEGKEILKLAMNNRLPESILKRKKMGFGVPLKQWFKTSLKSWISNRVLEGGLQQTGWFSKPGLSKLLETEQSRTLFNLAVLEAWLSRQKN
jgi:asparagine synthase (glutamine-hydrolysing)